ncbi:MAG TPA: biotin-dependent carboxyltransferase family protein [Candidatus Dormibacteraeota bacterium]
MTAGAVLRVEKPGLHCTLQDLGRPGHRLAGVPPGGAMDRFAIAAANRLVGNPESAGALEALLDGPVLVALEGCLIAVTGADFQPRLNGAEAPGWTAFWLAPGDRLTFAGRRSGARAYVAVGGGLAGDRWLGSVATYQLVGRGGIRGRPLRVGDELGLAADRAHPTISGRHLPEVRRPAYNTEPELSAVRGPHFERLQPASRRRLFGSWWEVTREADRMGYRLQGETLELRGEELISFGLAFGCVQVPASGQPILLMADHQTAGGYPAVAGVARAALPLAAQLLPGQRLRLREISVTDAQESWRVLRSHLAAIA